MNGAEMLKLTKPVIANYVSTRVFDGVRVVKAEDAAKIVAKFQSRDNDLAKKKKFA